MFCCKKATLQQFFDRLEHAYLNILLSTISEDNTIGVQADSKTSRICHAKCYFTLKNINCQFVEKSLTDLYATIVMARLVNIMLPDVGSTISTRKFLLPCGVS